MVTTRELIFSMYVVQDSGLLLVSFVDVAYLLIWLNETNLASQIDQMDQTDQARFTRADHRSARLPT